MYYVNLCCILETNNLEISTIVIIDITIVIDATIQMTKLGTTKHL